MPMACGVDEYLPIYSKHNLNLICMSLADGMLLQGTCVLFQIWKIRSLKKCLEVSGEVKNVAIHPSPFSVLHLSFASQPSWWLNVHFLKNSRSINNSVAYVFTVAALHVLSPQSKRKTLEPKISTKSSNCIVSKGKDQERSIYSYTYYLCLHIQDPSLSASKPV